MAKVEVMIQNTMMASVEKRIAEKTASMDETMKMLQANQEKLDEKLKLEAQLREQTKGELSDLSTSVEGLAGEMQSMQEANRQESEKMLELVNSNEEMIAHEVEQRKKAGAELQAVKEQMQLLQETSRQEAEEL